MKVAICGSRSIDNYALVESVIDEALRELLPKFVGKGGVVLLSGGAKGVDQHAQTYAKTKNLPFVLFKPYHMLDSTEEYKPKYFFVRNKQLVDNADAVVVIWDGKSNGTQHAKRYAESRRKPVFLVTFPEFAK